MTLQKALLWVLRLVAAFILLQTLRFKFTAAPESVYIFTTVGMEPWGRIGTGIIEGIAAILLLIPAATAYGAVLAMGMMAGALFFHFTKLGFVVMNDGGLLFGYACTVFIIAAILGWLYRDQLGWALPFLRKKV